MHGVKLEDRKDHAVQKHTLMTLSAVNLCHSNCYTRKKVWKGFVLLKKNIYSGIAFAEVIERQNYSTCSNNSLL